MSESKESNCWISSTRSPRTDSTPKLVMSKLYEIILTGRLEEAIRATGRGSSGDHLR
jgi:hypothetical protein